MHVSEDFVMGKFKYVEVYTTYKFYENSYMEDTYIFFLPALLFGEYLEAYIVPSNQLRENGYFVEYLPKHFTKIRLLHSIYVPEVELAAFGV